MMLGGCLLACPDHVCVVYTCRCSLLLCRVRSEEEAIKKMKRRRKRKEGEVSAQGRQGNSTSHTRYTTPA